MAASKFLNALTSRSLNLHRYLFPGGMVSASEIKPLGLHCAMQYQIMMGSIQTYTSLSIYGTILIAFLAADFSTIARMFPLTPDPQCGAHNNSPAQARILAPARTFY